MGGREIVKEVALEARSAGRQGNLDDSAIFGCRGAAHEVFAYQSVGDAGEPPRRYAEALREQSGVQGRDVAEGAQEAELREGQAEAGGKPLLLLLALFEEPEGEVGKSLSVGRVVARMHSILDSDKTCQSQI